MRVGRHDLAMAGLLLVALAPGLARAQAVDPCARDHVDEITRSRCARNLYGEREYVAAARHYERLWLDTGDPKYLYNAAAAREAAGHTASALAQWTRYGASPGVSAAERAEVDARLDEMRTRLVPVIVTVTPDEVLGPAATFWCERGEGRTQESFDIPAQLVAAARPGSYVLHLEPGAWELRLSPASAVSTYTTTSATVLVSEDTFDVPMPLASRPMHDGPAAQNDRVARRLLLGMGSAAGVSTVLGITLLVAGTDSSLPGLVDTGAGFLGAAVGLGVGAALDTRTPTRRRYQIPLGIGAGLASIGVIWHVTARTRGDSASAGSREASAVVLGAGASLAAGAGLSYLLRVWLPRKRQRITVGGLVRPHTAGIVLHGSF